MWSCYQVRLEHSESAYHFNFHRTTYLKNRALGVNVQGENTWLGGLHTKRGHFCTFLPWILNYRKKAQLWSPIGEGEDPAIVPIQTSSSSIYMGDFSKKCSIIPIMSPTSESLADAIPTSPVPLLTPGFSNVHSELPYPDNGDYTLESAAQYTRILNKPDVLRANFLEDTSRHLYCKELPSGTVVVTMVPTG